MASFRATNRRNSEEEMFGMYGGWGRTVHPSFFIVSFIFTGVCVCVCVCGSVWVCVCVVVCVCVCVL